MSNLLRFDVVARVGEDPEGIHQLRVTARRLRSELRVVSPVLDHQKVDPVRAELRWLGSVLGAQRDLDVLAALLHGSPAQSALLNTAVFEPLNRERSLEAARVRATLDQKRYQRLVRDLGVMVVAPALRRRSHRPARELFFEGLTRELTTFLRAVDTSGATTSNARLHRVRILAKRARYNCEVASQYLGDIAHEAAEALAKVQTVLGELHDRVVALDYVTIHLARVDLEERDPSADALVRWLENDLDTLRGSWRADVAEVKTLAAKLLD